MSLMCGIRSASVTPGVVETLLVLNGGPGRRVGWMGGSGRAARPRLPRSVAGCGADESGEAFLVRPQDGVGRGCHDRTGEDGVTRPCDAAPSASGPRTHPADKQVRHGIPVLVRAEWHDHHTLGRTASGCCTTAPTPTTPTPSPPPSTCCAFLRDRARRVRGPPPSPVFWCPTTGQRPLPCVCPASSPPAGGTALGQATTRPPGMPPPPTRAPDDAPDRAVVHLWMHFKMVRRSVLAVPRTA